VAPAYRAARSGRPLLTHRGPPCARGWELLSIRAAAPTPPRRRHPPPRPATRLCATRCATARPSPTLSATQWRAATTPNFAGQEGGLGRGVGAAVWGGIGCFASAFLTWGGSQGWVSGSAGPDLPIPCPPAARYFFVEPATHKLVGNKVGGRAARPGHLFLSCLHPPPTRTRPHPHAAHTHRPRCPAAVLVLFPALALRRVAQARRQGPRAPARGAAGGVADCIQRILCRKRLGGPPQGRGRPLTFPCCCTRRACTCAGRRGLCCRRPRGGGSAGDRARAAEGARVLAGRRRGARAAGRPRARVARRRRAALERRAAGGRDAGVTPASPWGATRPRGRAAGRTLFRACSHARSRFRNQQLYRPCLRRRRRGPGAGGRPPCSGARAGRRATRAHQGRRGPPPDFVSRRGRPRNGAGPVPVAVPGATQRQPPCPASTNAPSRGPPSSRAAPFRPAPPPRLLPPPPAPNIPAAFLACIPTSRRRFHCFCNAPGDPGPTRRSSRGARGRSPPGRPASSHPHLT
jgi:hypothetical protein